MKVVQFISIKYIKSDSKSDDKSDDKSCIKFETTKERLNNFPGLAAEIGNNNNVEISDCIIPDSIIQYLCHGKLDDIKFSDLENIGDIGIDEDFMVKIAKNKIRNIDISDSPPEASKENKQSLVDFIKKHWISHLVSPRFTTDELRQIDNMEFDKITEITENPIGAMLKFNEYFYLFSNLKTLDIKNNKIDELPETFKYLKNLEKLNISQCTNMKKCPEVLLKLHNLKKLACAQCSFTDNDEVVKKLISKGVKVSI